MLRSISLSKRSCSFSQAWRRCQLLAVRKSHSTAVVSPQSLEVSEGLFLKDYNPVWSSTTPLTEVVSLDDFGISTVQKLIPAADEKEIPLHKFLDHLMRSFPTTAEPVELGGTLELNDSERDSLETALSEGIDVSAVLRELSLDGETEPILIVRPPKRKPDLNVIPTALIVKASTAAVAASTSLISQPAPLLEIIPDVPSTSYAQTMVPAEEFELGLAEELIEAVDIQNASFLRVFRTKAWPKTTELGNATNKVLHFVITQSETSKEAFSHLENFFKSNPGYFLRDDLLLLLGMREIKESGLTSALEMLKKSRLLSLTRSNSRASRLDFSEYLHLFSTSLENGRFSETMKFYEGLSSLNFVQSQLAIRALVQAVLSKFESTDQNISQWIRISNATGQTEGVDLLWDKLLNFDKFIPENIGTILRHSQRIDHAYAALAELMCALVKNNRTDQAKLIFSKVYLSGSYLHRPLKRLVAKGDLSSIEKVAELISSYLFEEKKRGGKRIIETLSDESKYISTVIDRFIGANGRKPAPKIYDKKDIKKPKRHKVDENQLYGVAISIRNAWFKLAKDKDSQSRLRLWCERNAIEKLT